MAEDEPERHEAMRSIARTVANTPTLIGYEPADDEFAIHIEGDRYTFLTAQWDHQLSDLENAEAVSDYIRKVCADDNPTHALIIGYGPQGGDRAAAIKDAIGGTWNDPPRMGDIHAQDGHYRATSSKHWHPTPPRSPELGARGMPNPAPSRETLYARFTPLDEPLFQPLTPAAEHRLDRLPPGLRADIITNHITALAEQPDNRRMQAELAYLMAAHPAYRDLAATEASRSLPATDALTDTWRAAPPEHRDALGPAAATAHALTGNLTGAAAVSSHLPRADPITKVVTLQMASGMSASEVRTSVHASAQRFISEQDKHWTPPPRHASAPSLDQTPRHDPNITLHNRPPHHGEPGHQL